MDYKICMKRVNEKKSFILIMTIFLVMLFSYYSLSIIESNRISSNLNELKYLHLQAKVYMKYIKTYIENSSQEQIESFNLNDNRYELNITKIDDNQSIKYNITIASRSDIPIRLSEMILK